MYQIQGYFLKAGNTRLKYSTPPPSLTSPAPLLLGGLSPPLAPSLPLHGLSPPLAETLSLAVKLLGGRIAHPPQGWMGWSPGEEADEVAPPNVEAFSVVEALWDGEAGVPSPRTMFAVGASSLGTSYKTALPTVREPN